MQRTEPWLCFEFCMHCTIPHSAKPFKKVLSIVDTPIPSDQFICGRLKSPTRTHFFTFFLRVRVLTPFNISYIEYNDLIDIKTNYDLTNNEIELLDKVFSKYCIQDRDVFK